MTRSRAQRPKPKVVLVVEDEPTVRALAESSIGELGYATLSAANGREALALLMANNDIALLFTDINMPDIGPDAIDGIELARRAVELHPGLRVLYTTGGVPTDGTRALFVKDASFLAKPYTYDQLAKAVHDNT
jgi:CheY-like chemotaxis protein